MTQSPPPQGPPPTPLNYQASFGDVKFDFADFTAFRTMITVPIIKVLFWIFVIITVLSALFMLLVGPFIGGGFQSCIAGLILLVIGPILVRIYCEMAIVIFRINETLSEIKKVLEQR
jgi:hypothetical protein